MELTALMVVLAFVLRNAQLRVFEPGIRRLGTSTHVLPILNVIHTVVLRYADLRTRIYMSQHWSRISFFQAKHVVSKPRAKGGAII